MATLQRTVSRRLRDFAARPEMTSTASLVQAYNDASCDEDCLALFTWIENYVDVVSQSPPEKFNSKQLLEFSCLGKIRRTDNRTADLLNRVFCCLRKWVKKGEMCSQSVILALENFLVKVDSKVLEPEATNLVSLVTDLVDRIDPKTNPHDQTTYVSHAVCILTLQKALLILNSIQETELREQSMEFFLNTIKSRLNSISCEKNYFPIVYQAEVAKQNIKLLFRRSIRSFLADIGRYSFLFLCRGLHVCQGLREMVDLKFDLDVLIEGIKEIGQVVSEWRFPNIPDLYEISLATSEALGKDDFSIFFNCFESFGSWTRKWKNPRKSLMIKYALLMHLCLFFNEKVSETVQDEAMDLLQNLALNEMHSRWRYDPVLCDGLLEVTTSIAIQCGRHYDTCSHIFAQMQSSRDETQVKAIKNFLGTQTFEEKVYTRQMHGSNETHHSLFHIVKDHSGINQSFSMCARNRELLIENYKEDAFAKVPLIMGLHHDKHVKDFNFNLAVYEKVLVSNNIRGLSNQNDYDQVANNIQRTIRVKKPIDIAEIFKGQNKSKSGSLEESRVVLVIGNPGTGKTSLSKRLCYDWANDNWGSMFTHVYLLRVRQLGRISQSSPMDLVHAIVNLCYNPNHQYEYIEAIYDEVQDCLGDKSTLLILDGLDEGNQETWELVFISLKQPCTLLLLSRPHNVQRIRDKVDIEIECLEFSDEHLKSFISKELPQEDVEEFSQFLNQSSSIWEAARAPVNAQIICNMWTSSAKEELKTMNIINLAWLYDQMVKYVWMRYITKEDITIHAGERDSVMSSLEIIAFESFKQGKVEIPKSLVVEHSKTDSDSILRDAGFLLFIQEGQVFQFAHLTFHEYFVGRYLAKMLNSTNVREMRKVQRFICEHKYRDTSRVVFAFMIGIYCRDDDIEESLDCFKTLIDIFDDNPVEPIGWQHTFLKMRALDTFLTCCSDMDDLRSKDAQINEIVSEAIGVVKDWVEIDWGSSFNYGTYHTHGQLWDRVIDDLGDMPNLHREYSVFLEMMVNIKNIHHKIYEFGNSDQIIKIAKFNPQVVCKKVPQILNELEPLDDDDWHSWERWMCLYSKVNKECATDALSHLLLAYQRFGERICSSLMKIALFLLEVFPDNEEVKKIILNFSQHSDSDVRAHATQRISEHSFQPRSSIKTFAWSLQKRAMQDLDDDVKDAAFNWSHRDNQILPKEIDEMIEMLTKEINNPEISYYIIDNVYFLLNSVPHKENQLLSILKKLCLHGKRSIRGEASRVVWDIFYNSLLTNKKLLSFVLSICQGSHWDIQHDLLPLLSILETECESLSTSLVDAIANGSIDAHKEVKSMALACKEAREILSNTRIFRIQNQFNAFPASIQMEVLRQIYYRKLITLETADAIAEMVLFCTVSGNYETKSNFLLGGMEVPLNLLTEVSKEFLLSPNVIKELAKREIENKFAPEYHVLNTERIFKKKSATLLRKQPLDHLLNYYFQFKDEQIISAIAEKLLLTPVTFTQMSELEMKVTVIDEGNMVEKTVSSDDAQRLLFQCKKYLQKDPQFKLLGVLNHESQRVNWRTYFQLIFCSCKRK